LEDVRSPTIPIKSKTCKSFYLAWTRLKLPKNKEQKPKRWAKRLLKHSHRGKNEKKRRLNKNLSK